MPLAEERKHQNLSQAPEGERERRKGASRPKETTKRLGKTFKFYDDSRGKTPKKKHRNKKLSLSLLPRRRVDHPEVVVLHRRHAEDLVRVHPRSHDAEAHLGARSDAGPLVGGDKRRLASASSAVTAAASSAPAPAPAAAELVLVRDQMVRDKHLHRPGVGEEPDLGHGGDDGVEHLAPRRSEHQTAVPESKGRRSGPSVADRALADGLDARDADDEAVLPGAGALDLEGEENVFF